MYGMPTDASGAAFDPSAFLLSGYLVGALAAVVALAVLIGVLTLPLFFLAVFVLEQGARLLAEATGKLLFKVVLIMFRGLRRSPLRTSLTYVALFVFTAVLSMVYSVLSFLAAVTTEKEANFKAIVSEKHSLPSQMPPGYYDRFKAVLDQLPPENRPKNGDADVVSWTFVLTTTDPSSKRPENNLFMFALEPRKALTMMDGLEPENLTAAEQKMLNDGVAAMEKNKQAIILSAGRLKKMNLRVGQRVRAYGINYPDTAVEVEIVGTIPDGKWENLGFMNKAYFDDIIKAKGPDYAMKDKTLNLVWVRLPDRQSFEKLAALVDNPANFSGPAAKLETASAGIGAFLDSLKDILFGLKYVLSPAMVCIMALVVANAISISVRERRTEMAVLKVLGFQPWHVMGLVLGEAVLVGVLAGAMSTFICWYGIGNLKLQLAFFGAFFVPWVVLVLGPTLGLLVSVAGSIGPALAAKDVKAAEVFAKVA